MVAKATEAVGDGVAKATQAAGQVLNTATNEAKTLAVELLTKTTVNVTAMVGNREGCIEASIGSSEIGSVCGELSSRLLVLMWLSVVFLLLSSLCILSMLLPGQDRANMVFIRWPAVFLSGLGTLAALVVFLVPHFFELLLNSLNKQVDGYMDVGWAYKGSIGIFVIACVHLVSMTFLYSSHPSAVGGGRKEPFQAIDPPMRERQLTEHRAN